MADTMVVSDGNAEQNITTESTNAAGELKSVDLELALVVQSARMSKAFIANKQWTLLWRDADLLFQSPRPMQSTRTLMSSNRTSSGSRLRKFATR